ncbi:conserved hypothetical protein [Leishmania braziliensis MHOM/BR/75/M2904]|uniref:Uncharacterized protein n=2 Tax=Leishmania braziliensis TaxID=5660 RepID=A4HKU3_LEIBR|nr:conserved hypothetical protein [Leishmania braziliensis MHOM/BR/75/M2904]CAJ2478836.1 unnamed protein product [Leishmania braziliensis]CAJ2479236.1 unnamed protein product [Leishmania braziliensis]CAM43121.1 conserved hypothetical protein [Leishmania braziliensis MHOM/BR/75/M2904]SYZ68827.1 hypothetical_protein [Leishmania braziliensis MHOM/BR/75/M2904]
MLFKASGEDYVSLHEVCRIFDASTGNTMSNTVDICSLNNGAIQRVWTELLLYLNRCTRSVGRFVIHNIDTLCSISEGAYEFLVSLLLAGVASILRYYSCTRDREELLNSVCVEFTVLNTELGSRIADSLQFFVEKSLRLTVSRTREDNYKATYDGVVSSTHYMECSGDDWMDVICSEIVDIHEMLCDKDIDATGSGCFTSPIVLLIAPQIPSLRIALEKQILDSYSTEALRVQSDREWSHDMFNKKTPLVFICSSHWLIEQMSMPKVDGLLRRLNVQIVVHAGFCEIGDSHEEEILRCVIALKGCGIQWEEMRAMKHKEQSYWRLDEPFTFRNNSPLVQECANALLLLFRRFVTPYSPCSKQPYTSLQRDLFCSRRAWDFYNRLTHMLRLAGVLAPEAAAPSEAIELTVLGRFLSYRFRIGEGIVVDDTLTVADGKAILWAFLFRQPISVPHDVIKSCHAFDLWVDAAVANFCKAYRLEFETEASTPRKALVTQLALFGIGDWAIQDRVHYLLSSPSGVRLSLRQHFVTAAPTSCRGWYEQAPLNAGLALEKKEVHVFCIPPPSAYCELEAVEKGASSCIQCPMELSYPLIVAHSVLHISLHNICVFSETVDPSIVTPLPRNLLESGVMSSLLCDLTRGNAGFWLDGVMNEIVLTSSASSVLAPLTLKGRQHIPYCERELFTRKRPRQEIGAAKAGEMEGFKGTLPRTAAERSAVEELAELIRTIGREKAEKAVRGKKGFSFLEPSHELYPFYLYSLKR